MTRFDGKAPRTSERYERLRKTLEEHVWCPLEKVIPRRELDLAYHDVAGDIRMLAEKAARWEHHTRVTGQSAFGWTNEDGSIDRDDKTPPPAVGDHRT